MRRKHTLLSEEGTNSSFTNIKLSGLKAPTSVLLRRRICIQLVRISKSDRLVEVRPEIYSSNKLKY